MAVIEAHLVQGSVGRTQCGCHCRSSGFSFGQGCKSFIPVGASCKHLAHCLLQPDSTTLILTKPVSERWPFLRCLEFPQRAHFVEVSDFFGMYLFSSYSFRRWQNSNAEHMFSSALVICWTQELHWLPFLLNCCSPSTLLSQVEITSGLGFL